MWTKIKPFVWLVLAITIVLSNSYRSSQALYESCTNPRGEPGRCVFLRECRPLLDIFKAQEVSPLESKFFYESQCSRKSNGKPLVCCSPPPPASMVLPRPPADCGRSSPDRIIGGKETELGEFSWMALLVYMDPNGDTSMDCGASLINSRYVVTATHCIKGISGNKTLIGVRLGEHNITNSERDCDQYNNCADAPVDVGIEKVIVCEGYNRFTKYNDIALIRLDRDVGISDYINPICLPIEDWERQMNHTGRKAWAAGWGSTESSEKSDVKLKVALDVIDLGACRRKNIMYRKLSHTQLCAGGKVDEDTCKGDSGGPLMRLIQGNYYLIGIISHGSTSCGINDFPGVYTNVAKFVDWIQRNLE